MIISVLFLILPLFIPFLTPLFSIINKKFGKILSLIIYTAGIVIGIMMIPEILKAPKVINIGGWDRLVAINLYFSPLSLFGGIFIYITAFIININDLKTEKSAYYNMLYQLFVFANLGILLTADFFNLFVLLEIASIASIALIAKGSEKKGSDGAVKYIVVSAIASMFMLAAVGLLYSAAGTLNIAKIITKPALSSLFGLLAGFGILSILLYHSELFPFNTWVPGAYNGSHYSFAGSLAGIGGISGSIVLGRIFITVINHNDSLFVNSAFLLKILLLTAGIISILIGEIAALKEKNIKKVLAFSSISQMGMAAVAFSMGGMEFLKPALFIILGHGLAKILLLLIASHFAQQTGTDNWDQMKGIGRKNIILAVSFTAGALSLMGIPLFMGFWGKLGLIMGLVKNIDLSFKTIIPLISIIVILGASIIEGTYFIRISHALFEKSENDLSNKRNIILIITSIIITAVIIIIGVYPALIGNILDKISYDLSDYNEYINNILNIKGQL